MKSKMILIQDQYFEKKIECFFSVLEKIEARLKEAEVKINIIEPDRTDVHNINKRIELLARRIAALESKPKKQWWPFQRGETVK